MEIPYTVEERPDTGLINSKLGIWLFLASEVMLFGGLFSAYVFLRLGAPDGAFHEWGQELNVPLATLNTLILISSSVTMVMSWASLKMNDFKKFKMYMGITLLCSVGFLIIKYIEYTSKFHHGIFPSTNTFMAIYFTLTGLHGLHIIGGMIVNGFLMGPGSKMWKTEPEHFTNRIEIAGLYWHFVDLVWIFLFPVLYLL
ncbi:MAG TPA: heme-copper oxidase subunit III [Candidatus Marinimicrobia bacterium]|jgi:heme/copper-type cytochrome/quinol oxidase subunit 3|nr:heme-copper oxidase subunit III [Candidatus Neomarinimicrobiota bacterium]